MVYYGTSVIETIWIGPEDETHYIELIKADDEPIFYVTICCDEDWIWAFYLDGISNYEMIKHTIINVALDCDNMGELMNVLDVIFMEEFADIIVEDECRCDGDCCEYCNHRDCLNE